MFDSHILYLLYDYASIATINKRRKKDKNKLKIANLTPSLKYRKRNIHKKKKYVQEYSIDGTDFRFLIYLTLPLKYYMFSRDSTHFLIITDEKI